MSRTASARAGFVVVFSGYISAARPQRPTEKVGVVAFRHASVVGIVGAVPVPDGTVSLRMQLGDEAARGIEEALAGEPPVSWRLRPGDGADT